MENIKQQIEETKKQLGNLNDAFGKWIKKLEQQVNKPKIEVGKWYKAKNAPYLKGLWFVESILETEPMNNRYYSFGFGNLSGEFLPIDYRDKSDELADMNEVTEALTKHADKLYEGVEKVDRSLMWEHMVEPIVKFELSGKTIWDEDGCRYKGKYVMNENGVWAKPVIEEKEMWVNLYDNRELSDKLSVPFYSESEAKNQQTRYKILGTFKLVKVG